MANLKNNSNQGLCLFRQEQMLKLYRRKKFQNQSNEGFFLKYITQFIKENVMQTMKHKSLKCNQSLSKSNLHYHQALFYK